jgi:uncharacterized membrane protein
MDLLFFGLFVVLGLIFFWLGHKFENSVFLISAGLFFLITGLMVSSVAGGGLSYSQPVNSSRVYAPGYFEFTNSTPLNSGDVIENKTISGTYTDSTGFQVVAVDSTLQNLVGLVLMITGFMTIMQAVLEYRNYESERKRDGSEVYRREDE